MAIQKTEAFILKTQPFRSSSLIVTFFSRSFGKLRGLVKGVRREGEIRGAIYELFTHVEIVFYEKTRSDLHLVSDAAILESNDALRSQLSNIAYASYFSELVDIVSEVHDPHEKIFELLEFAFRYLRALPPERLTALFEIELLNEIGWLPYLDACLGCDEVQFEAGFFSVRQGALFCPKCAPQFPDARPLKPEVLNTMRYYIHHDLEDCLKIQMSRQAHIDLEKLMEQFLLYRLGSPLKSKYFLQEIKIALQK